MLLNKLYPWFIIISLLLIASGCAAPATQGWSGITSHGDTLYIGSMEGKILALNPSARIQRLPFPAQGEWKFPETGSLPGPTTSTIGLACARQPSYPTVYGTPAVSGELVYVGTYLGRVYAFYANAGQKKWVYPDEGSSERLGNIVGDISVVDDRVYFCSSEGIYVLDATYGQLVWHFKTDGKVWTSPVVKDKTVFAGSFDGKLYALSSDDGRELWTFQAPAAIASAPVVWEDSVFFGAFDRHLYCVADGKEKWRFEGENWFWARPLVNNNIVYASCLDGKIYALKADTGEKLWQLEVNSPIVSSPVLMDNSLVVISDTGKLYIINPDTPDTNNTLDIIKPIPTKSSVMAPLYEKKGIVYIHAKNRHLYAVKIPEKEILWDFDLIELK